MPVCRYTQLYYKLNLGSRETITTPLFSLSLKYEDQTTYLRFAVDSRHFAGAVVPDVCKLKKDSSGLELTPALVTVRFFFDF